MAEMWMTEEDNQWINDNYAYIDAKTGFYIELGRVHTIQPCSTQGTEGIVISLETNHNVVILNSNQAEDFLFKFLAFKKRMNKLVEKASQHERSVRAIDKKNGVV